jgi:hypothetical protein
MCGLSAALPAIARALGMAWCRRPTATVAASARCGSKLFAAMRTLAHGALVHSLRAPVQIGWLNGRESRRRREVEGGERCGPRLGVRLKDQCLPAEFLCFQTAASDFRIETVSTEIITLAKLGNTKCFSEIIHFRPTVGRRPPWSAAFDGRQIDAAPESKKIEGLFSWPTIIAFWPTIPFAATQATFRVAPAWSLPMAAGRRIIRANGPRGYTSKHRSSRRSQRLRLVAPSED